MPQKQFGLEGFKTVEARNAMQVEIRQGPSFEVTLEADAEIIDEVEVSVTGSQLKARFQTKLSHLGLLFKQVPSPKLVITMPELEAVKLAAATRGRMSGFAGQTGFSAELAGASKLTGDIECAELKLEGGAASFFELAGKAQTLEVNLSGTSHASLEKLTAGDVAAKLSGASTLTVDIQGKLDADITGASSLRWTGAPVLGDVKVTGASSLARK